MLLGESESMFAEFVVGEREEILAVDAQATEGGRVLRESNGAQPGAHITDRPVMCTRLAEVSIMRKRLVRGDEEARNGSSILPGPGRRRAVPSDAASIRGDTRRGEETIKARRGRHGARRKDKRRKRATLVGDHNVPSATKRASGALRRRSV